MVTELVDSNVFEDDALESFVGETLEMGKVFGFKDERI